LGFVAALDPADRGRAYLVVAAIYRTTGETERAVELYERALELLEEAARPYLIEAARQLSQLLEELGRPLEALQVLKRGLRTEQELATAAGVPVKPGVPR
jgi:tetratricopeptide (TPR) repeat protein